MQHYIVTVPRYGILLYINTVANFKIFLKRKNISNLGRDKSEYCLESSYSDYVFLNNKIIIYPDVHILQLFFKTWLLLVVFFSCNISYSFTALDCRNMHWSGLRISFWLIITETYKDNITVEMDQYFSLRCEHCMMEFQFNNFWSQTLIVWSWILKCNGWHPSARFKRCG